MAKCQIKNKLVELTERWEKRGRLLRWLVEECQNDPEFGAMVLEVMTTNPNQPEDSPTPPTRSAKP